MDKSGCNVGIELIISIIRAAGADGLPESELRLEARQRLNVSTEARMQNQFDYCYSWILLAMLLANLVICLPNANLCLSQSEDLSLI